MHQRLLKRIAWWWKGGDTPSPSDAPKNIQLRPSWGQTIIAGHAPQAQSSNSAVELTPAAGQISISGYAPSILDSQNIATPDLALQNGIATMSYVPLANEVSKEPTITDIEITSDLGFAVGSTLTAIVTGEIHGPYTEGSHEYQWYRLNTLYEGTLTEIVDATSDTYLIDALDEANYLVCKARFVRAGTTINNKSEWMHSEPTVLIGADSGGDPEPPVDGDISHSWEDFFDIESGASIPGNWNTAGVSPSLYNFGSNADWTADELSKPTFSTDRLIFDGAHRITGVSESHPPKFEVWIKAKFRTLTNGGILLSHGNQTLFGNDTSGNFISNGLTPQAGDTNEHVFRIVFNGASSIFQMDGGSEVVFDENTASATVLNLGCSNSGASFGEFELLRFQRTASNVFLTPTEVANKWTFHGFGTTPGDIDHAWEDFFDIESGASIPANWNDVGVSPSLINLGSNANWTTVEATKPAFSTDKLVFNNAHRVTGVSEAFPPVFEVWMKARYLGGNAAGVWFSHGNQTLFGTNTSGQFISNGMPNQTGDTSEHVFRIVFNGASSILQIDGGAEVTFDESNSSATVLNLGCLNSGASFGDFELKRFQRTASGVVLTTQEVADKWTYHGF